MCEPGPAAVAKLHQANVLSLVLPQSQYMPPAIVVLPSQSLIALAVPVTLSRPLALF